MPRGVVTAVSAVLAATLVGVAAPVGVAASVAVAVVLGAAVALGWPVLLSLPSPRGTTGVVLGTGAAAALVVGATPDDPWLRRLPVALALAVLAACAHQLLRRDLRPRVVDSLGGTLGGAALAASAAGWVVVPATPGGWPLSAAAAASGAIACAALLAPWPLLLKAALAVAAAAVTGAAASTAVAQVPAADGAAVGAGVAVVVVVLHALFAPLPTAGRVRSRVAMVAAPLTASGTVAYGLGRVLLG